MLQFEPQGQNRLGLLEQHLRFANEPVEDKSIPATLLDDPAEPDDPEIIANLMYVPEREHTHYLTLQRIRKSTYKKLLPAWEKYKRKLASLYIRKDAGERPSPFDEYFTTARAVMSNTIGQGIAAGDSYFRDTFALRGLNDEQQNKIRDQYLDTFDSRFVSTYRDKVQRELDDNKPFDGFEAINNTLTRFNSILRAYSNIATSIGYDTFTSEVGMLNVALHSMGLEAQKALVQWVLLDGVSHSYDCLNLAIAPGVDGTPGVYDPNMLIDTNTMPGSVMLDCGGNCKCHLSPVQSNRVVPRARSASPIFTAETLADTDHWKIDPNMTPDEFKGMFASKNWIGSGEGQTPKWILDWMAEEPTIRRKDLWQHLDDFAITDDEGVLGPGFGRRGVSFDIQRSEGGWQSYGGITHLTPAEVAGKRVMHANDIVVYIKVDAKVYDKYKLGELPSEGSIDPYIPRSEIPADILKASMKTLVHELGHSLWFYPTDIQHSFGALDFRIAGGWAENTVTKEATEKLSTLLNSHYDSLVHRVGTKLLQAIDDPDFRAQFIAQYKTDVGIDIIKNWIIEKPTTMFHDLWNMQIGGGGVKGGLGHRGILKQLSDLLESTGIMLEEGGQLFSSYSLHDVNEYWAELFSQIVLNPKAAMIYNPEITQQMGKLFPELFISAKTGKKYLDIPSQVAPEMRNALLDFNYDNVFLPNSTFSKLLERITINTSAVTKAEIAIAMKETVKHNPHFFRHEFIENADIVIIDSEQMGRLTKNKYAVSLFEDNTLYINYSQWQHAVPENRIAEMTDAVGASVYARNRKIQPKVRKVYEESVLDSLRTVLADMEDIMEDVDSDADEATADAAGLLSEYIQSIDAGTQKFSIKGWMKMYEDNDEIPYVFKRLVNAPILSTESLASPAAFFKKWFSTYISTPHVAHWKYNGKMTDILRTLLKDDLDTVTDIFGENGLDITPEEIDRLIKG